MDSSLYLLLFMLPDEKNSISSKGTAQYYVVNICWQSTCQIANLAMVISLRFFGLFPFTQGPRSFLAWLPLWQLWAIFFIHIHPIWPPVNWAKFRISTIKPKMMCDTTFPHNLDTRNPILKLFLWLKVTFKVKC